MPPPPPPLWNLSPPPPKPNRASSPCSPKPHDSNNAPDRKHITAAINKLRALVQQIADIPADAETPQNPAAKLVFSLLKVRKLLLRRKQRAEGLDDALARMELLITTGQHDLYLAGTFRRRRHNGKKHKRHRTIAISHRLFAQLQDMGAPQYRLGTGV